MKGLVKFLMVTMVCAMGMTMIGCGAMFTGNVAKINLNAKQDGVTVEIQPIVKAKPDASVKPAESKPGLAPNTQTVSGATTVIPKTVTAPATVTLPKKADYNLIAHKDGYKDQTITITRKPQTTYLILDCIWFPVGGLVGGLIAVGLDYGTAGIYEFDQTNITFDLQPAPPTAKQEDAETGNHG